MSGTWSNLDISLIYRSGVTLKLFFMWLDQIQVNKLVNNFRGSRNNFVARPETQNQRAWWAARHVLIADIVCRIKRYIESFQN